MGGLLFVVIPVIIYLLMNTNAFSDKKVMFVILSYVLYCFVGFLDDILIIVRKNNDGISPISKLIMEFIFTLVLYFVFKDIISTKIAIPFTKASVDFGIFYIPFMFLLFMAEANAANFTDGMDGLCAGVSCIGLIVFAVLLALKNESDLLLLVICVIGAILGYLYFNWHPAKIFMGDSGSLALGALYAALAVVLKCEVALFFIGGVFVIEMFCVVVQQLAVRIFHKRVFTYTPIHYAFVIKKYNEVKIVIGFYLVELVLGIIGLILGIN